MFCTIGHLRKNKMDSQVYCLYLLDSRLILQKEKTSEFSIRWVTLLESVFSFCYFCAETGTHMSYISACLEICFSPALSCPFSLCGTSGSSLSVEGSRHLFSFALWWLCLLLVVCLLDFWPVFASSLGGVRVCLPQACLVPNSLLLPALWC